MVKYRLQVSEPDLLKLLTPLSGDRLRKVAVAVCELALKRSGLESPLVSEAMACLRKGVPVPASLRTELQGLVNKLDEQYFSLKEAEDGADSELAIQEDDSPTAPSHLMFHKARAAAAVLFACEEDPLFATAEATDEARVAAHDDVGAIRTAISRALE